VSDEPPRSLAPVPSVSSGASDSSSAGDDAVSVDRSPRAVASAESSRGADPGNVTSGCSVAEWDGRTADGSGVGSSLPGEVAADFDRSAPESCSTMGERTFVSFV
jgi:hypothetical protein